MAAWRRGTSLSGLRGRSTRGPGQVAPRSGLLGAVSPPRCQGLGFGGACKTAQGTDGPGAGGGGGGAGLGRQVGAPRLRVFPPSSPGEWRPRVVLACLMVGARRRGGAGPVAAAPCPPISEETSLGIFLPGSHRASGSENWGHSTELTSSAEKRLLSQVGQRKGVMVSARGL